MEPTPSLSFQSSSLLASCLFFRPDPLQYKVGNLVLAKQAVNSNKAKGRVDKSHYAYTGPWKIMAKLLSGSYKIKHTRIGKLGKKRDVHLQPIPEELLAFAPLYGTDSRFDQLYKNINDIAYESAEI